jgi:hypothetical protein
VKESSQDISLKGISMKNLASRLNGSPANAARRVIAVTVVS